MPVYPLGAEQFTRHRHHLTAVCLRPPPNFQSPPASDADCNQAGFRAVDCPVRLRVDDAFACYREDDSDWFDAWRVPAILSDKEA